MQKTYAEVVGAAGKFNKNSFPSENPSEATEAENDLEV